MIDGLAPAGAARVAPAGPAAGLRRWAERLASLAGWRRVAVAMGLGGLAALAMPPVYAAPLLLVVFPALLWLLDGAESRRAAFLVGWSFGFGFFVCGLYWIAFALTVDLASFFWMIPLALAGVPAGLAIFTGLVGLAYRALPLRGLGRPLGFAVLWVLAEWLRGHVLTGFPWNLMGYAWVGWAPVLQAVAVIGIYGLSLLTVAVAALPAALVDRQGWSRAGVRATMLGLGLFAALAAGGALRLAGAGGDTVPGVLLRLVQPNIPQAEKGDRSRRAEHLALHQALSAATGAETVTHVVWPETALPGDPGRDAAAGQAIADVTPPGGLTILGGVRIAGDAAPYRYFNSLFALDPAGAVVAAYDKGHLVPFGEYVPLRGLLPIDKVTPGLVDFSAGPGVTTLTLPGLPPASPLICYEVIFPGAVAAAEGPQWLLNITNDGWYGETAGPYQHFAIARTRAVEEGLPLVRAATTGISGVVDPYGRVTARLGLGLRGVIDAALPAALPGRTPYARWGDLPFWALAVGLALLAGVAARRRRKVRGPVG